jgi:hypothetical protein
MQFCTRVRQELYDNCVSSGPGFLAMLVFAFVLITITLVLALARACGHQLGKSLWPEFWMTLAAAFFILIAIIIWGSTCYQATKDADNRCISDAKPRAYIYVIFGLFFTLLALPAYWLISHAGAVGVGGARSDWDWSMWRPRRDTQGPTAASESSQRMQGQRGGGASGLLGSTSTTGVDERQQSGPAPWRVGGATGTGSSTTSSFMPQTQPQPQQGETAIPVR